MKYFNCNIKNNLSIFSVMALKKYFDAIQFFNKEKN